MLITTRYWDEEIQSYVLVTKGHVEGLSVAKFKAHRDDSEEYLRKLKDDIVEPYKLETVPGADAVVLVNINLPFPMSNRSFMSCTYFNDNADGSYWQCASSKDTEALCEQHQDKIGYNVIAINHMDFTLIKDTETGAEWQHILIHDLAGSMMNIVKTKVSEKQAPESHKRVHDILTGDKLMDYE